MKRYIKSSVFSDSLPSYPNFWSLSTEDQDNLVDEFCDSSYFELAAQDLENNRGPQDSEEYLPWQVVWSDPYQGDDAYYNFASKKEARQFIERHPDLMACFESGEAYLHKVR